MKRQFLRSVFFLFHYNFVYVCMRFCWDSIFLTRTSREQHLHTRFNARNIPNLRCYGSPYTPTFLSAISTIHSSSVVKIFGHDYFVQAHNFLSRNRENTSEIFWYNSLRARCFRSCIGSVWLSWRKIYSTNTKINHMIRCTTRALKKEGYNNVSVCKMNILPSSVTRSKNKKIK